MSMHVCNDTWTLVNISFIIYHSPSVRNINVERKTIYIVRTKEEKRRNVKG